MNMNTQKITPAESQEIAQIVATHMVQRLPLPQVLTLKSGKTINFYEGN